MLSDAYFISFYQGNFYYLEFQNLQQRRLTGYTMVRNYESILYHEHHPSHSIRRNNYAKKQMDFR